MLKASHKTGLVFFPAFDWAIGPTHPEREERLLYTRDQVFEEGILDVEGIREYRPELASVEDVQRVHFCVPDVDSAMTESHYISAGGAMTIGRAVLDGEIERGFALVRPPGHHAMRMVHGGRGFCNVNNEAIMIEALRRRYGIRRVAIVDTDCHHGDGTQDIYWHDPDTLFISIHQDGRTLYPGSGFPEEQGGPNALGTTINIPLPPNTSDAGYLEIVRDTVLPILEEFEPELIVNSAGQDNHFSDPLTNMNFTARGYAELTTLLKPHIAVLEGGYSIEGALPYVNMGIILAMAGLDYGQVIEPDLCPESIAQSPEVGDYVRRLGELTRRNWRERHDRMAALRANGQRLQRRSRRIHYDTSGISERQEETVRLCERCGGALRIESTADQGWPVLAVHIPPHACEDCRRTGRDWFEEGKRGRFGRVFLQDRPEDRFEIA
ncbi:histone deacetylase family protein [Imhoffiella purpurea]|uniref:Deacetylase n=1 Tax=Imhoffiella purpurea TaxID=1249627 RepID=W9V295_9GAMM|nr:histone deacetylase [Imhoffiella purpurea]EXJ11066.1 Deacetylase [Imhoffiella purpurea]